MAIKVVIADDHEMVRAGLKNMFEGTDIRVVGEGASGESAVKQTMRHNPDVVVLDVRMPDQDGLYALGRIKLERPDTAVIMLSTYDNPTYIARAVALGAAGYLHKDVDRETMVDAVQRAAAGEHLWTREELRRVTGALAAPRLNADVEVPLTQRESEVLRHLSLGLTNKQIAEQLDISYETVKEHVQHILRKIGVGDRTQAAVWSVRKGLI